MLLEISRKLICKLKITRDWRQVIFRRLAFKFHGRFVGVYIAIQAKKLLEANPVAEEAGP